MIIDPTLGPSAPELGWVPAPRYLLRRALILRELRSIDPCEVLEIGPGAGMLLHELDAYGFRCRGLEMSAAARVVADTLAREAGRDIRFFEDPCTDWAGQFGLLMAFEVLEHIERDLDALHEWRRWLNPGGCMLLSVPSHMRKWNPADVWAGHYRRYERASLLELVRTAGFEVERILCYGFPLANLVEKVNTRGYAQDVNEAVDSTTAGKHDNSARSGIDRQRIMKWYPLIRSPLGKLALHGADLAQRTFLGTELGNGYLLRARAK
jgi:SAM-dependent methyltransferase